MAQISVLRGLIAEQYSRTPRRQRSRLAISVFAIPDAVNTNCIRYTRKEDPVVAHAEPVPALKLALESLDIAVSGLNESEEPFKYKHRGLLAEAAYVGARLVGPVNLERHAC